MRMRNIQILIFLGAILLSFSSRAQDQPLNAEEWEKLSRKVEYVQGEKAKKELPKPEQTSSRGEPRQAPGGSMLELGPVARVVIISAFVLVLLIILYLVIGQGALIPRRVRGTEEAEPDPTQLEETPMSANLQAWLDRSLAEQNFQLAVRICFLMTLKGLEDLRLIRWEKEKTNWHYLQELQGSRYRDGFAGLVMDFNETWYGERQFSNEAYDLKIRKFREFNRQLKNQV